MATTLALTVAPVMVAAPADAASGCVTKSEFKAVDKGWNMKRVHRKFGTGGKLEFQSGSYKSREYRPCKRPKYSYVSISYNHGRVSSKSAFWF